MRLGFLAFILLFRRLLVLKEFLLFFCSDWKEVREVCLYSYLNLRLFTCFVSTAKSKVKHQISWQMDVALLGRFQYRGSRQKVSPILVRNIECQFILRQRYDRRRDGCRMVITFALLCFGWGQVCFLLLSEFLYNVDKFVHRPVLEIIEVVGFGAKLYEFLRVVAGFNDILSEVLLFGLEGVVLHLCDCL